MAKYQGESLFGMGAVSEPACNHIARVAFESAVDTEFDYAVPDELWPVHLGQRVEAPFGKQNRLEVGFCVGEDIPLAESFVGRGKAKQLKQISRVVDAEPLLHAKLMELARWISEYYVCPLGQVLAAMVPAAVKKGIGEKTQKFVYLAVSKGDIQKRLGRKQRLVVEHLEEKQALLPQAAVDLEKVRQSVGCTDSPIKKLAESQIIKVVRRTTLRALPAVPETMTIATEKVVLNSDQRTALAHFAAEIESGRFGVTLLHGVTDSGKTELYIRAIEAVLRKGRTAIILLPEIALTAQTVQRFSARFDRIAVMHSGLTATQRNAQWQKIKAGGADVVIGARSAVFAPLSKLGLVVVDEEHEPSYKQDTAPRYHGRDVAIKRAQLEKAHCILGSATPSLETLFNCRARKHFHLVALPKRVMNLPFPQMELVDMRHQHYSRQYGMNLLSEPLAENLERVLARKEQAILLLNRRGYSNFVFCASCKHTLHCRNCDVALTFHKVKGPGGKRPRRYVAGNGHGQAHAIRSRGLSLLSGPDSCAREVPAVRERHGHDRSWLPATRRGAVAKVPPGPGLKG
ncbi:MAG: replication restart helicase PriA [Planctomycetota bacterium]|jgi:primosomal protein N' (replication factor Y)